MWCLLAVAVCALAPQDVPGRTRPHQRAVQIDGVGRVHLAVTTADAGAQRFFDQGLAMLFAGEAHEADRAFRESARRDPECALAWFGMALANRAEPRRAEKLLGEARRRADGTTPCERALLEAGLDGDLAAVEALFPAQVEVAALRIEALDASPRRAGLIEALLARAPDHPLVRLRVLAADRDTPSDAIWQCARVAPAVASMWRTSAEAFARTGRIAESIEARRAAHRADLAHMQRTGAMPHEVDGCVRNLVALCEALREIGRTGEAAELAERVEALPRHATRDDGVAALAAWRAGATASGEAARGDTTRGDTTRRDTERGDAERGDSPALAEPLWTPPPAPPLRLPRADGSELSLAEHAGRPVLVVFFLGFGCVHCVDQLRDLAPRAGDFARAGIPIVAIGTDTIEQVKASFQRAIEADEEPLPFPILSDPAHAAFREWGCHDAYDDEPLHGTFLVDANGRVRWQDVGVEPFLGTGFLLEECRRLLRR